MIQSLLFKLFNSFQKIFTGTILLVILSAVAIASNDSYAQNFSTINFKDGADSFGSSWGDFDNDGDLDLFVAGFDDGSKLYRNDGGIFCDISTVINNISSSRSGSWGDFDNDGDLDLFVARGGSGGRINNLYENKGNSNFTIISFTDSSDSQSCSWIDYDNDGDLDLFITNFDTTNFLYRNKLTDSGDPTFERIDTDGDLVNDNVPSTGCSWADYDNDGDMDLFVANFDTMNFLYRNLLIPSNVATFERMNVFDNDERGRFFGGSWGDFDNDGNLDLFVISGDTSAKKNILYKNKGNGTFKKNSGGDIASDISRSRSSSWSDFDNDGDLDLFVANEFSTEDSTGNNFLYENNGNGILEKMETGDIVVDSSLSRGCSWADYDEDGDLDLFVSNRRNENDFLYQNNSNGNKWINIRCVGVLSNTSAIGTKVKVKAAINDSSIWQMQEISGQTSGFSQNSLNAEFGLGNAAIIDSIKIEWPSGIEQVLKNIPVDTLITIEEPVDISFTLIDEPFIDGGDHSKGCSWGDYDNDGYLELFVSNESSNNDFYENEEGTFKKISQGAIVTDEGKSTGSTWGDYDNDGDLDLFVANGNSENNFLYQNSGPPKYTFSKITNGSIGNDGGNSFGTSWVDYDNDGNLDLFVANHEDQNNFLYKNFDNGNFIRITSGPVVNDGGKSFGVSWSDYDNDNDQDLFIANVSELGEKNFFYQNKGNGDFNSITDNSIVTDQGNSWSGSWGDYDNDGDFDLFVTEWICDPSGKSCKRSRLYRNDKGDFVSITSFISEGIIREEDGAQSVGSCWGDYDNDGDLDLFVINHDGTNGNNKRTNFLYVNDGNGAFLKKRLFINKAFSALEDNIRSQSCSWGDYDNDGDLDLFITNFDTTNFLYRNDSKKANENNSINIRCVGTVSNASAIGAKVKVKAEIGGQPVWQMREVSGQTGHLSQNSLNVAFGLGDAAVADSIKIEWPSGLLWVATNVADNRLTITEQKTITNAATNIADTSAMLSGTVNPISLSTAVLFEWGQDTMYGNFEPILNLLQDSSDTTVTVELNELTPGVTYHYRVLTLSGFGTTYGIDQSFKTDLPVYPSTYKINTSIEFPEFSDISAYRTNHYRLVGLPGASSLSVKDFLSGEQRKDWRVFWDNGNSGGPNVYLKEFDSSSDFQFLLGRAFWILQTRPMEIDTIVPTADLTDEAVTITLCPDWNLITNPYDRGIAWSQIQNENGITEPIYSFDRGFEQVQMFEPYQGYYFNNTTSLSELKIPYAFVFRNSLSNTSSSTITWQIQMTLYAGDYRDRTACFGVAKEAQNDLDHFDLRKPRAVAAIPSVSFHRPEWDGNFSTFATDIRAESEALQTWNFEVTTTERKTARITFAGVGSIPKTLQIYQMFEFILLMKPDSRLLTCVLIQSTALCRPECVKK